MCKILFGEEFASCVPAELTPSTTAEGRIHRFKLSQSLTHTLNHAFHSVSIHQEGSCLDRVEGQRVVDLVLAAIEVGRR
jgi:hypothetical protein